MIWQFRALQLFGAASVALILAVSLGLQNPFWAAMPVWVVSQPWREDLVMRGIYRVLGTVVGAAVGYLALTHLPDDASRSVVLVLAVAGCAAAAFRIGKVYSYGVILAGMTVAVVLVPAMDHAVDAARLAADRIWCTLIGVIAVTAATFPFTPRRPEPHPLLETPTMREVALRGGLAGAAVLIGTVALHGLGGPAGIGTALSACIFGTVIASARDPAPMLRYMAPGSTLGVAAALAYRLLDEALPDPAGMALLLAVAFIAVGAVLRCNPRTAPMGLDSNMCFLLAAEAGTAGHGMPAHLAGGAALVVSAFAITTAFRLALKR